jgi:SAM-dependent methyltransferase
MENARDGGLHGVPGQSSNVTPRTVESEILDSLAPDDPAAVHNRRDLRITNLLMGNHRWLARTLPQVVRPGERVLEIAAGTGELAARLERAGLAVDGLDRWPEPPGWPRARAWHQTDLLTFDRYGEYPVVIANLILHQFSDAELAALGRRLRASVRVLVACEPLRRRMSQWFYRAAGPLFGAHPVSLHDAHVSIAAGFAGGELPEALGFSPDDWAIDCRAAPVGAYHLVAVRRPCS